MWIIDVLGWEAEIKVKKTYLHMCSTEAILHPATIRSMTYGRICIPALTWH